MSSPRLSTYIAQFWIATGHMPLMPLQPETNQQLNLTPLKQHKLYNEVNNTLGFKFSIAGLLALHWLKPRVVNALVARPT